MPFEEIPHTADWSIRVWADDLAGLLAEFARGMNWLAGAELSEGPRIKKPLKPKSQMAKVCWWLSCPSWSTTPSRKIWASTILISS